MQVKGNVARKMEKAIAKMAKMSASVEANTACPCWNYQPKEPQNVKKLRKF
ncbi:MAG: cyclic lactone autoinducer peptide [Lachnospiraceae bacterium]|nr:cyclic lactone autoinducer peptide [Lachnospiraceae bacterium]